MSEWWFRSLGLGDLPDLISIPIQRKFTSIYSIVDSDRFYSVPAKKRRDIRQKLGVYGSPLLVYVASFNPIKAQQQFIEHVVPILKRKLQDVKVAFVGDFAPKQDAHARDCLETVSRRDVEEHVVFAGYQSNVERWYQAADLTVLASEKEGLARAMIESIACGTPVVSFDVASAHEILTQHQCGVVVPQGEYNAFADAVTELWEDESRRDEMGLNGVRIARELFDPETIARQYERLYENVARSS
ncbi:glycosyltransferase family 4 protein [Salinibacter ruber]|uniref:glycosyltransferase family 4 protein n=1 Tax=Salinibacter ruber TaxID=146919 RepID=UPI00161C2874|nr:glycosyltransferase family 4 protein [Salinibacter ruber]MBB4091150.1 glycosyltransferase involved in cell wall biosynthesis [Salinibacter ruber]